MGRGRRVSARALSEGRRNRAAWPGLSRGIWRYRSRQFHVDRRGAGIGAGRRGRRQRQPEEHSIGAPPIARAASPEFKARVLPEILSGKKISALAITEPSG